ncbi:IS110 family transposase [bacterium]|nr:IS110 family transposase [bacterium]
MNNITKSDIKINEKTLISSVDIGTSTHYGYWRTITGIDCKTFKFSNTLEGFTKFKDIIFKAQKANNMESIIVGFEATGPYAEPFIHYLKAEKIQMVQINPYHTKRVKELNDNSPCKTDIKDPRVIADIIQLGHYLSVIVPTGIYADLRKLAHMRERAIKENTVFLNRLFSLICITFPEFFRVIKRIQGKTAQYFLRNYPFPKDIRRIGYKRLAKKIKRVSKGRFGTKHAQKLYEFARSSIGITEGLESIRTEMCYLLERVKHTTEYIAELEQKMSEFLDEVPCSKSLLSIKGVGIVTAASIVGEIGDFRDYRSAKALLKFAGMNLFEVSSGTHKGIKRISKRGRKLLRKILYYAALNTVRKHGIMHAYYTRLVLNGTVRTKAIVAVMRKLLIIMFALTKNNTLYDTEYSQKLAA